MNIIWSPEAIRDLKEAAYYTDKTTPNLLPEFRDTIAQTISLLIEIPLLGRQGFVEGTREFTLKRFPFRIIYRFRNAELEVVRLMHHARDYQ